jgi:hypothetical protein
MANQKPPDMGNMGMWAGVAAIGLFGAYYISYHFLLMSLVGFWRLFRGH